jgi:hypothetical protein
MSGTANTPLFWKLPQLLNLVSEWAALIPLVCHLASFQTDYQTTGRVSLLGRLTVSMFPRLGDLASLSRLCKDGPEYLDEVSLHMNESWRKCALAETYSRQALEEAQVKQCEMFNGEASFLAQMEQAVR